MGGTSPQQPCDRPGVVLPRRAAVAPRVRPLGGGEVLRLEDRALRLIREKSRGLINLCGPAGSGKTTALQHLAAVLPRDASVSFFDQGNVPPGSPGAGLVFYTSSKVHGGDVAEFEMAPWTDDDLIEYLVATHRDACQAVMFKIKSYAQHLSLGGSPALWRAILDAMADDDSIDDVSAALRRVLETPLSDPKLTAASVCLAWLRNPNLGGAARVLLKLDSHVRQLVEHRSVQIALASELIVRNLCDGVGAAVLDEPLPHDLIVETARLAAHWPAVVEQLTALVCGNKRRAHPMAASLLLAIRPEWKPASAVIPTLSGAFVAGAHWAGADLHECALEHTDLAGADLSDGDLTRAHADDAILRGAVLRNARLDRLRACRVNLAGAQMASASARGAHFVEADLHGADLRSAELSGADLTRADLSEAMLTSANLCDAVLDGTKLDGADLVGADFTGATLQHVCLRDANLCATKFTRADLRSCDLEGLSAPSGNFSGAKLAGCYFTGAVMPNADFHDADLRHTGLADVQWENADLRDADLRGATFHMGSTRSGLVGSSIPSEGSKTGFYTDDFSDRDFKTPEEIRKANLCGADLRGAKLKGVDFYLVDLRGAHYTDHQREQFLRCGAILD